MKTFGLFSIILSISWLFWGMILPDSFSGAEKMIIGMLFAWFMYKLIKEDNNHP